jgi:BirA family biotin operon repressor/biotin-[acetyl-CoA-carboxylase] ligase
VKLAELPGVAALEVHRSLPSTNERARQWIREGVAPVAVVVAREQTAGRGRGGRRWVSGAGEGLWMSVIVEAGGPELSPLLPVRVGLALAWRLERLPGLPAAGRKIRLKWPNDLFCGAGKVGGILCETVRDRVVVGVGLNCRVPKVEAAYPVGALVGVEPSALVPLVAAAVLEASSRRDPSLDDAEVAEWRRRDVLAGAEVVLEEGGRGTARGIDGRGRLLVSEAGGGTRAVVAGSVRPVAPLQTESG